MRVLETQHRSATRTVSLLTAEPFVHHCLFCLWMWMCARNMSLVPCICEIKYFCLHLFAVFAVLCLYEQVGVHFLLTA